MAVKAEVFVFSFLVFTHIKSHSRIHDEHWTDRFSAFYLENLYYLLFIKICEVQADKESQ